MNNERRIELTNGRKGSLIRPHLARLGGEDYVVDILVPYMENSQSGWVRLANGWEGYLMPAWIEWDKEGGR